jgi:hypothetical protein
VALAGGGRYGSGRFKKKIQSREELYLQPDVRTAACAGGAGLGWTRRLLRLRSLAKNMAWGRAQSLNFPLIGQSWKGRGFRLLLKLERWRTGTLPGVPVSIHSAVCRAWVPRHLGVAWRGGN